MAAKKTARKTGSDVGNPFTLLAEAFDKGRLDTCSELLTNIYEHLRLSASANAAEFFKKVLAGGTGI